MPARTPDDQEAAAITNGTLKQLADRIMGMEPRRALIDGGAALSLVVALIVIFWLAPREKATQLQKVEMMDASSQVASDEPVLERPLRLAVTPYEYDDVGKLLETLGAGYRFTSIKMDDLLDSKRIASYDVLFLSCAGAPKEWLGQRLATGVRGSAGKFEARGDVIEMLRRTLRQYVADGGTIYASDLQFQILQLVFPEWIDESRIGQGAVQTLKAEVVDPGLRRQLGATIELKFDKPAWRPAAFSGPMVTTYLRGQYKLAGDKVGEGPLLVGFSHGSGNVIFTSFHNEAQNSQVETELLKNLVFTTVTARVDASVKQTLLRGGFSPRERNLLSASKGNDAVTETYQCRAARHLQFVVGFENRGAELKLSVVGPDGRTFEKTGHSTFVIDVPQPAQGPWRYTLTPVKIPHANFPFTFTIGEKE